MGVQSIYCPIILQATLFRLCLTCLEFFRVAATSRSPQPPVTRAVGQLRTISCVKMTHFFDQEYELPRIMSTYANTVFVVLWVGFVTALVLNREWLDVLWNWVQVLHPAPKIIIWVIFTPIMVGLWIWESFLASSWTLGGIYRYRCLDFYWPCPVYIKPFGRFAFTG